MLFHCIQNLQLFDAHSGASSLIMSPALKNLDPLLKRSDHYYRDDPSTHGPLNHGTRSNDRVERGSFTKDCLDSAQLCHFSLRHLKLTHAKTFLKHW